MNENTTSLKKWRYYFEEIELFGGTKKQTRLVRKSKQ